MFNPNAQHITLGGPAYIKRAHGDRRWPLYTIEVVKAVEADTPDGDTMIVSRWTQLRGPFSDLDKAMRDGVQLHALRKSGVRLVQWNSKNNDKHILRDFDL